MLSTLFMLNGSGEVLIEKQFREKIPRSSLEDFWSTYMAPLSRLENAATVVQYSRFVFIHIIRDGTVFLGIATHEVSPMLIVEILTMIAQKLQTYLKSLTEDVLKENFSLVYQLLEELIHNGYPLTTDYYVLEELVPRNTIENRVRSLLDKPKNCPRQNDGSLNIAWRSPDIKYSANEIFFDVTEYMDVVINAEGIVVRSSVRGIIDCLCHLSGMPDVALTLRNTEVMEDVAYHRCVRHSRFETDRTISFIPPDGPFQLFQYQCKSIVGLAPPLYVNPQITFSKNSGRINCMVGLRWGPAALERGKEIHKAVIHIPCPPNTESVCVTAVSTGTHSFNQTTKVLTWKVGQITVNSPSLSAELVLTQSDDVEEGSGEPVTVQFQIPNYSISSIKVDTVNVQYGGPKPYKGVKYMTKAGRFTVKTV